MKKDDIAENVLKHGKEGVKQNIIEALDEFCDECADEMWKVVEEVIKLRTENAALRERLEKAVELPCKIGDKVYMPWVYDGISGIAEITAMSITIFDGEFICDTDLASDDINFKQEYSYGQFRDFDFGTKVFTTLKAAEARLAELKGEKGCAKT